MHLLDTNILMNKKVATGVLTYPVLEELDNLKTMSGIIGKKARDAVRFLHNHLDYFIICSEKRDINETVDDFLLRVAKKHSYPLLTMDISLMLKARHEGIEVSTLAEEPLPFEEGATELEAEEYALLMSNTLCRDFPENHFLIHEKWGYQIRDGHPHELKYKSLPEGLSGTIKPRNIEQYCLAELLTNNTPIVCATGTFGTGKSYLMLNYALAQLEQEKINKLVFIPANAYVKDSFEIAALPGGILEKQVHMLGPLIDIVGETRILSYVEQEKIEILPIAVARGRSFTNSIIYCSEAQNLSEEHMLLIISRLGENSRLFVDGDYKGQIDRNIFRNSNGIRLLMRLTETPAAKFFGTIRLKEIERGELANLAALLSNLEEEAD